MLIREFGVNESEIICLSVIDVGSPYFFYYLSNGFFTLNHDKIGIFDVLLGYLV